MNKTHLGETCSVPMKTAHPPSLRVISHDRFFSITSVTAVTTRARPSMHPCTAFYLQRTSALRSGPSAPNHLSQRLPLVPTGVLRLLPV
jgi:hypothetical protein